MVYSSLSKTGFEFFIPERGTKLLENGFNSIIKKKREASNHYGSLPYQESSKKDYLIRKENILYLMISSELFVFSLLKKEIFLFDVLKDERAKKYSIESLF